MRIQCDICAIVIENKLGYFVNNREHLTESELKDKYYIEGIDFERDESKNNNVDEQLKRMYEMAIVKPNVIKRTNSEHIKRALDLLERTLSILPHSSDVEHNHLRNAVCCLSEINVDSMEFNSDDVVSKKYVGDMVVDVIARLDDIRGIGLMPRGARAGLNDCINILDGLV